LRLPRSIKGGLNAWPNWQAVLPTLLKFVLRNSFDAVQKDIHEFLAATRDIELQGTVPKTQVMRSAKRTIEAAHAGKHKSAACRGAHSAGCVRSDSGTYRRGGHLHRFPGSWRVSRASSPG